MRCANLNDSARPHDADAITERQGLFLIVGHQHKGDSKLPLDILQLDLHFLAQLAVKCRQRLIQKQKLRLVHDRTGQGHALLLTARHLPDTPILETGKAYGIKGTRDLLFDHAARKPRAALLAAHSRCFVLPSDAEKARSSGTPC